MDSNQTHCCGGQEDNVDLWRKLKVAKNNLITQTEFFSKYRPPSDNSVFSSKNLDRESKLTAGESSLKPEGEQPETKVVTVGDRGPSDHYTSGLDSKESTSQMIDKPHPVNKEHGNPVASPAGLQTVGEIFQDLSVQNAVEVNAGLQGRPLSNAGIPVVEGPPDCGESIVTHAEPNLNCERTSTVVVTSSEPIGIEGTLFSSRYLAITNSIYAKILSPQQKGLIQMTPM
jgi:hypothetical protein